MDFSKEEQIKYGVLPKMPKDNSVTSSLNFLPPSEELLEYAHRKLGEDPETRCQVLAEFRDLIYERGECLPHRMDDAFLLKFLRAKYFVVRHAHRLLVSYYEFKETYPEFFEDVVMMELSKVSDLHILRVPPYTEQTGRRMLIYRWGLWDPEQVSVIEAFKASFLILELAILEEKTQILGGVCIFDLGGLSTDQMWHMTPTIAKQMFQIFAKSFPVRAHSVHILNQPRVFGTIFNLFKPLMNEQMRKRVYIHGDNMESLHEHVYPQFLPKRYGGVHDDYDYNDWIQFFRSSERVRWEMSTLGYVFDREELNNNNEKV